MDAYLLRAIQHHNARAAIGSSSMRGAGSAGVVASARSFLGEMPLRPFWTSSASKFLCRLDSATDDLKGDFRKGAQRFGPKGPEYFPPPLPLNDVPSRRVLGAGRAMFRNPARQHYRNSLDEGITRGPFSLENSSGA